jgi:hypothetical protein
MRMPFQPKDWKNEPDEDTPLSAAALEDLEDRLTAYSDEIAYGPVFRPVEDFGAIGNGVTDDTAALRACLDAAYSASKTNRGVRVLLGPYTYLCNEETITDRGGNCLLPLTDGEIISSVEPQGSDPSITIEGVEPNVPFMGHQSIILVTNETHDYSATYGPPSVMGTLTREQDPTSAFGGILPVVGGVKLKNFQISLPENPTIAGIDCLGASGYDLENVKVEAEGDSAVPTEIHAFGFRGVELWGTWQQRISNSRFRGMYAGIVVPHMDHFELMHGYCAFNQIALGFEEPFMGGAGTAANGGYLISSWCKTILGGYAVDVGETSLTSPGSTLAPYIDWTVAWEEGSSPFNASQTVLDTNNIISGRLRTARFNLNHQANAGTFVGGQNIQVETCRKAFRTVASAATFTAPPGNDLISVTGSTTITAITASYPGRELTLVFASTAQVTDNGGTLNLNGNFTGGANRVLKVVCDGTNWLEVSRSAN